MPIERSTWLAARAYSPEPLPYQAFSLAGFNGVQPASTGAPSGRMRSQFSRSAIRVDRREVVRTVATDLVGRAVGDRGLASRRSVLTLRCPRTDCGPGPFTAGDFRSCELTSEGTPPVRQKGPTAPSIGRSWPFRSIRCPPPGASGRSQPWPSQGSRVGTVQPRIERVRFPGRCFPPCPRSCSRCPSSSPSAAAGSLLPAFGPHPLS